MSTLKQKMLARKVIENNGNISKSMREVGYSPESAKNPQDFFFRDGVQKELDPIIAKLDKAINRAINLLPSKVKKAQYNHLTEGVDKFSKLKQLLSGKETERITHTIYQNLDDEQLKQQLERTRNQRAGIESGAGEKDKTQPLEIRPQA